MASEDSVEDLTLRDSPILAVSIDGVSKRDELNDAFATLMPPLADQVDGGGEDLVVRYARRKAHVAPEERNNYVPQDLSIRDLQDEHILVPGFREDRARSELLRSHFEESPSVPVLIQKELRLDEVAERSRAVPLQRHTYAAFSFNEAG
jgi:hypothetical protein